jgi:uncharacterized protein
MMTDVTFGHYWAALKTEIPLKSAQAVLELAADGGTVPFIARYRKEKTGNLDEVQIRTVLEANETLTELNKRRTFVAKEIESQGNMTDAIAQRLKTCYDLGEIEEIYRPFKKKKKTKATLAREGGLEPLANWIWALGRSELVDETTLEVKAKDFLNLAAGFGTYQEVLKGAQDIIVERLSNDPELREMTRRLYAEDGRVTSKVGKGYKAHSKYEMYKEFSESVTSLMEAKASHRYLAMRRGWTEEELVVSIVADDELLLRRFENAAAPKAASQASDFLKACAKTALTVHVQPSIVNELHRILKEKADGHAIAVFAENVRRVLLGSPFGPRCVLGVDPGLRTGAKLALIDKQGGFISHTVMQILGDGAEEKAKTLFGEVLKQIKIDAIAVGNGTGGRETEGFLRRVLKSLEQNIPVILISEAGASVYSASDIAREEFPDLDLTVRGAISIARRLQDPLAELVKVDPKSIGVGQYQHDVNQTALKKSLEHVVESCVNGVGVDVNTASVPLLSSVAGIGPALAANIVEYRKGNGLFQERDEILKVPRFSSKAFEQCAGFLRIPQGKFVLDSTGVHPERYKAVRDMAQELGISVGNLVGDGARRLVEIRTKWTALIGEYTFDDIVRELEKPGRDPRDPFKVFAFRDDIFELKDLKEGMICPGLVTNVTNFGAFVDIGVHQDGLVHISEISEKFVDDPRKVVNPGDSVTVRVLAVDLDKTQISLSMRLDPKAAAPRRSGASPEDRARKTPKAGREKRPVETEARRQEIDPSLGKPTPRDASASASAPRDRSQSGGSRPGGRPGQRSASSQGPRFDGPRPASGGRTDGPRSSGGPGGTSRGGQPFNNPFAALTQKPGPGSSGDSAKKG